MKTSRPIIQKLLLTEKGSRLQEQQNKYLFRVDAAANKLEIKKAVQAAFNVTVTKVNVMNRKGKEKRLRTMTPGRTSNWKRAVVTLKEGDKIDLT
jgi:large subunit ribosomal protein L23